jgi:two-component sensor histidine kinase
MSPPGALTPHSPERRGCHVELELHATRDAPALAREAVLDMCTETGERDMRALPAPLERNLMLLVSEVVTNAVLHARSPASPLLLTADARSDVVLFAITDSKHGFGDEAKRHAGGYGLFLLDKLTSRWGVEDAGPETLGTKTWFEFSLAGREAERAHVS